MSPTSPPLAVRSLQVAAVGLGIATLVLFAMWLQHDATTAVPVAATTTPIATADAPTTAPPTTNAVAAAAADASSTDRNMGLAPEPVSSARALLVGTVKRADGTLVEKGSVFLEGMQSGESIEKGAFAITGVEPGARELTARIDDELPVQQSIDVKTPRTRVDLVLAPKWSLTVNAVTPEGKPLSDEMRKLGMSPANGLRAIALEAPCPHDSLPIGNENLDLGVGAFRPNDLFGRREKALPKEVVGTFTLPPGRPVHVALRFAGAIVAQMPASPDQSQITFTLAADAVTATMATVRLRTVDANGAPRAGVKVALSGPGSYGGGTPTDADGRITLSKLLPGRVTLRIVDAKLQARPTEIVLRSGENVDLGAIEVFETVAVELSIDGTSDRRSVIVTCLEATGGGRAKPVATSHHAFSGNSLKLQLTPGRHAVFVGAPDGCALLELDTRALPPQPIHVVPRPAANLLVQSRLQGSFAHVTIRTTSGAVLFERELSGRYERTLQLPVGVHEVVRSGPDGITTESLQLGASGSTLTLR